MTDSAQQRPKRDCDNCELRSLRMFCNLGADALQAFNSIGVQRNLSKGTKLFQEGQSSGELFVICTGQVKLSCVSKEGKVLILKIAMPGDVLGLGAVISGSKYEVTAEVVQPTQVKHIHREEFLRFLESHGEASLHAAKTLSEEYKSVFFDARRLALSGSAASRLAGLLLEWGRAASCGKADMRFTVALTHEEVANMVGSFRETVTRTFSKFKKDHLIRIKGSSILILSPEKLEELCA